MYPKRFTLDPKQIERARTVTLRSPSLDVLPDEHRAKLSGLPHFLELGFKARDAQKKLLLPDLSALANQTVGIFSDYGGEDKGSRFFTYSFLVCAFGSLDPFKEQMAKLRSTSGLGVKEIAFKYFQYGPLKRMLPDYLRLSDNYINGFLFTLAVEKTIPSLFGPGDSETTQRMIDALAETGYGTATPKVAEKLFRILHCIAFLISLLGHADQKIFWMMDHDPIGESSEKHTSLLGVLNNVLPLYTNKPFSFLGGARPFTPKAFEYLDLLSLPDVAAGTIAQILTSIEVLGKENFQVKEGADHVLRWLSYNSIVLKKFAMMISRLPNGEVGYGPIDLEARKPADGEMFIPTELVL